MRIFILVLGLIVACSETQAQEEIRQGATMWVKGNSMWFQSESELSTWHRDQVHLSPEALKIHQEDVLRSREAWQFDDSQRVKVLTTYYTTENEVEVKMLGPGRFQGFVWWVDTQDLMRSHSSAGHEPAAMTDQ